MKRHALLLSLVLLLAALAGCDRAPDQPAATPIPPPPTLAATTELILPTPLTGGATAPATAAAATPAAAATDPATVEPTATVAGADATPTPWPTVTPEPAATPSPAAPGGDSFAPGQATGSTLATGGSTAYRAQGQRFQPLILFVEPVNQLDVALAVYGGDLSGQTTPEGVTPLTAADNALAGRPEILVLSPEADGAYTFVVRAASGEGSYTARLYDLTTSGPDMAVQQSDTLDGGTEKAYAVNSRGARPVIAVADPSDLSDIALDVLGADGALVTTANYGGPGGAETAYVLPLGATSFTVKVREVNGAVAAFQIAIITLE